MSQKRQDVLETAEYLFYQKGFHSVGIKQIISEASVSLMTLYNHFDSKEALVLAVLNNREDTYFSFLKNQFDLNSINSIQEKAQKVMESHLLWLEKMDTNGCLFLRAKEEYTHENDEITKRVISHKKFILSYLEDSGFSKNDAFRLAIQLEGATALAETSNITHIRKECLSIIDLLFHP
ncbi:TetR/AcrR family transcriptional regulator [Marinilactibacillus kalidii]|uniref:TetR/AcrR family transcriptional regulator n=1 Tax=Marinilactibacillus kalidii TaxID=2820274 RepID=UPI001ABEDC7B|nr:TetR/AcrR family transcriptional regulator [Marinilactibacillus kalidii]